MNKKITYILLLLFCSLGVLGQENFKNLNLTPVQKELLKTQKDLIKNNRKSFKATLSKAQKEILANKALTKQQRQKALRKTLSVTQKQILIDNRASLQKAKVHFRSTLTKAQRQRIKTRLKRNRGQNRNNLKKSVRLKRWQDKRKNK